MGNAELHFLLAQSRHRDHGFHQDHVRTPTPRPNPRYRELLTKLAGHPEWLTSWKGHFFRFQTLHFPSASDILSGAGAKQRGGRWNPPGLAALYGSTTDSAALEETKANDRYYGLVTTTPRLVVAIHASTDKLLDLSSTVTRRQLAVTLRELAGEDWRKLLQSGQESLSQAIGRAAAESGASGLRVRSAAVPHAHNIVLFPPLSDPCQMTIVEGEALNRLSSHSEP